MRAALQHTRTKRVGVIGTAGTIASRAYEEAIYRFDPNVEVFSQACPLFVLIVENGLVDSPEAAKVAEEYLRPLREAGVDALILGCTHYPLMANVIRAVMGPAVKLISSAQETALEAQEILVRLNLLGPASAAARHRFFVIGSPGSFVEMAEKLFCRHIQAYQVTLP
ncbi:glutamate racemase [Candidatus Hakubella thermalkaliphila]|uniref:Glutamate racemase n=1 Tax=Candidatus Hakubella thermalkaliphila TaxID=2754717 RepID=A0A6V8NNB7_9ACTN|nr:glutamate racemase [Candidatus Hakubella thermalkaliphila]